MTAPEHEWKALRDAATAASEPHDTDAAAKAESRFQHYRDAIGRAEAQIQGSPMTPTPSTPSMTAPDKTGATGAVLSDQNRALVDRVLGVPFGFVDYNKVPYAADLNRLLDAARAEALAAPEEGELADLIQRLRSAVTATALPNMTTYAAPRAWDAKALFDEAADALAALSASPGVRTDDIGLQPGWLARDTAKATARIAEWEGHPGEAVARIERVGQALALPPLTLPTAATEDAELRRDALRWRALMRTPRIRMQGSAGVNPETGARTAGTAVHFGVEFWSDMGPNYDPATDRQNAREWGARALTALADAIIEREENSQ
jgi:hypothetical protein